MEMKVLDMATVAKRLGCSKGHVSKLINGRVKGTPVLPCVALGRKKLVMETTLYDYMKQLEANGIPR
jgi:hypothetical protein